LQVQCLGAWTVSGPVLPADPKTASSLDKVTLETAQTIADRCPADALASLHLCAGADANGMASCIRCAAFDQLVGLVRDTYGPP
jgi:hypothetical protein